MPEPVRDAGAPQMNARTALLIIELIELATLAARCGGEALASFRDQKVRLEQMIRDGNEPRSDDVAALHDAITTLRTRMQMD